MQDELLWGAAIAALIAAAAVFAERRRHRRAELDRVGFMPWALIQVLAFMVAVICGVLAVIG